MRVDKLTDLTIEAAEAALGSAYFNLIRRGADGSLVLSADKWQLAERTEELLRFLALAEEAEPLELPLVDIERISWDRLPKQQLRSQLRFYLRSGDLWTFSGQVDEAALGG